MSKLNVGIADDNELIVSLLSDIVAQDEELRVVGTARNGEEAYQMIKQNSRMWYYWISLCQKWTGLLLWTRSKEIKPSKEP